MTTALKLVRVALILGAQFATPVFAQAVIDEPGNYAFFHPNADVLNPPRPGDPAITPTPFERSFDSLRLSVPPHRARRAPAARAD